MRNPHLAVVWHRCPRAIGCERLMEDAHIRDVFRWLLIDHYMSGIAGVLRQAWYGHAPSSQAYTTHQECGA